jgi:O-glycosyl hydrolase
MSTPLNTLCVCLGLASLGVAADAPARADYTATADPSVQYKTWQGWGTSLAWWAKVVGGFPEPVRSEYMDRAFDPVKGLGLNVVRYNIGGGENPAYRAPNPPFLSFRAAVPGFQSAPGVWDWTADANQRWVLHAAIRRGADQLEAFSNSPPWWMTRSGSVTGNVGGRDNLKPDSDAAFGDYLAGVVGHFHDAWGVTFRDLEPLNEPSPGWWTFGGGGNRQEGCHVDPPHQNEVVKAAGAALARRGITATTVAASDESLISDAVNTTGFYDRTALGYLSKINTHSYGGGNRTQLSTFAASAGKDLWLSEYGDGDASGMQLSRQILTDVNGLHPTAWVYWQVVDGGGWGLMVNGLGDETNTAYTLNKKYFVLGQYSKFLRPGFRLFALDDENSLAGWDPKTHTLVVVTTNGGDAPSRVTFDLSRFTHLGASVTATRTSPTENLTKLPPTAVSGRRFTAALPAKSVTTFVLARVAYDGPQAARFPGYSTLTDGNGRPAADGEGVGRQWSLRAMGNGLYGIVNRRSGLVLDVSQASTEAGALVFPYADNGGLNQQWRLTPRAGGTYTVVNRSSGLALSQGPTGLTQQPVGDAPAQRWRLRPVKPGG